MNPKGDDVDSVVIKPSFIGDLSCASAYHISPAGKIGVSWKRENGYIKLTLEIPKEISASVELDSSYCFENGTNIEEHISSGIYRIKKDESHVR